MSSDVAFDNADNAATTMPHVAVFALVPLLRTTLQFRSQKIIICDADLFFILLLAYCYLNSSNLCERLS